MLTRLVPVPRPTTTDSFAHFPSKKDPRSLTFGTNLFRNSDAAPAAFLIEEVPIDRPPFVPSLNNLVIRPLDFNDPPSGPLRYRGDALDQSFLEWSIEVSESPQTASEEWQLTLDAQTTQGPYIGPWENNDPTPEAIQNRWSPAIFTFSIRFMGDNGIRAFLRHTPLCFDDPLLEE